MERSLRQYVRLALREVDRSANKALSQNFLVDEQVLADILTAAELKASDTVLEIGPGLGVLTRELIVRVARVEAVELDREFAAALKQMDNKRLHVHEADISKFDLSTITRPYKVVANIPYHLTGLILRQFLDTSHKPESLTLLIQKEVAERIVATAGKLSVLALMIQYYGQADLIRYISKNSFEPRPKVDSALIHIRLNGSKSADPKLFRLIKSGFAAKRKTLKNNLVAAQLVSASQFDSIASSLGIGLAARAQELTLGDWLKLKQAIF